MAIFESFQPENVYLSPAKLIKKNTTTTTTTTTTTKTCKIEILNRKDTRMEVTLE